MVSVFEETLGVVFRETHPEEALWVQSSKSGSSYPESSDSLQCQIVSFIETVPGEAEISRYLSSNETLFDGREAGDDAQRIVDEYPGEERLPFIESVVWPL